MSVRRNSTTILALATAAKRAAQAQAASEREAEKRAALPIGSSRAKVTSANARWSRCAEDRDRAFVALEAALADAVTP